MLYSLRIVQASKERLFPDHNNVIQTRQASAIPHQFLFARDGRLDVSHRF